MQETFVNSGWFNLEAATGRSLCRIPLALREPEEGIGHVSSLCVAYGDPWVNPCSGGVIGQQGFAESLGRSVRQVQRKVFGTQLGEAIRWVGDMPAASAATLQVIKGTLDTQARAAHLKALRLPTACSSGSNR